MLTNIHIEYSQSLHLFKSHFTVIFYKSISKLLRNEPIDLIIYLFIEGNTFSNLVLIFHVALFSWVETSTKQCG